MLRATLNFIGMNIMALGSLKLGVIAIGLTMHQIDKKYLREFRCPTDNKLLAKGFLTDSGSVLEAKCRVCGTVSLFRGEDREIIKTRQILLRQGKIPDTE